VHDTPKSISKAYASLDVDYWKEAIQSEMDSIFVNGTWDVTDQPYGCKSLVVSGCSKRSLGLIVLQKV
jgi:hypothetical protein